MYYKLVKNAGLAHMSPSKSLAFLCPRNPPPPGQLSRSLPDPGIGSAINLAISIDPKKKKVQCKIKTTKKNHMTKLKNIKEQVKKNEEIKKMRIKLF